MKTLLYTFSILVLFASCRSIEKLVDKGNYDEAIFLATKKLAGKKNKKTKHVKYLEEAFGKINNMDMQKIHNLDAENNPYNWERVLALSQKIENRQNRISAFLPLISKDGYQANFNFVKTGILINKALDGAAAYNYARGIELLDEAMNTSDKKKAQNAYYAFKDAESFRRSYKDVVRLKELSRELGMVEILVDFKKGEFHSLEKDILLREFEIISTSDLNRFWTNFSTRFDTAVAYDLIAEFQLLDMFVSPERLETNRHTDRKKIKDGWEYVKKKDGEIKTDSLGNKLKRDVYRMASAQVLETIMEKSSMLRGQLSLIDARTAKRIDIIPFGEEIHFNDYSLEFRGDRKALCEHDLSRIDHRPLFFPSDMDMLMQAGLNMKHSLIHELKDITLN